MKRMLALAAMLSIPFVGTALDAGVSITVGEPGFYGQIHIGRTLVPQLIYPQPVIIAPPPAAVVLQPIYLHVPPGHAKRWSKYCRKYDACGRRVYFVQDAWYNDVYVPHYREHRDEYRKKHRRRRDRDDHHGHDDDHGHKRGGKHD